MSNANLIYQVHDVPTIFSTPKPDKNSSNSNPSTNNNERARARTRTHARSVLDNKETLVQFLVGNNGSKEAKNSFIKVAYRKKNLTLANWLEKSSHGLLEIGQTHKTIRRLRYCSSMAILAADNEVVEIDRTSKSCKSPHCAICLRARSAKISKRLITAITSPKYKERFDNKYYYFVTFTVKHDRETRTGVYLESFRNDLKKFYRSKWWKANFPYSKNDPKSGWITAYETTMCDRTNGFHIHAHVLLCCPKIKKSAKVMQQQMQDKWLKITGDSHQVRFDLLNLKKQLSDAKAGTVERDNVYKAVAELIKYGTKSGNFNRWNKTKAEMYSEWIEKTKGANFINCSGLFRGLGITALKSDFDEKPPERLIDDSGRTKYFIGRMCDIQFNHSPNWLTKQNRRRVLKDVKLTAAKEFFNVTGKASHLIQFTQNGFDNSDLQHLLPQWVNDIHAPLLAAMNPADDGLTEIERQMKLQRKLFDVTPFVKRNETPDLSTNW